jgi:hypothetical protein
MMRRSNREILMRSKAAIGIAICIAASSAMPAFAAEPMMAGGGAMMSSHHAMMLKPGEALVVMPNGETMTTPMAKGAMDAAMMKSATPVDKCMVFMMGSDHMMHMVTDAKMANGKTACKPASAMAH